jgi:hypothetical protein
MALGASEYHHHIGRLADFGVSLDGVPEVVNRDEHIVAVGEEGVKVFFEGHHHFGLLGVLRYRFAVRFGIDDFGLCCSGLHRHHPKKYTMPK